MQARQIVPDHQPMVAFQGKTRIFRLQKGQEIFQVVLVGADRMRGSIRSARNTAGNAASAVPFHFYYRF